MAENVSPNIIIELVLRGGPPWGFRIKQRNDTVIISKVSCGGRASRNGLKQNDEIVAVNNLEIDRHPLTLDVEDNDDKLTKLDFTYQLIKHTLNKSLHLKVKRTNLGEQSQSCCYPQQDDEDEKKDKESILPNGIERRRSELNGFQGNFNNCVHQQAIQNQANVQQANGIHQTNLQQANGIHQTNGVAIKANQLPHPFAGYCISKATEEEIVLLSPNDEDAFNTQQQQLSQSQNYPQFISNLNQLNGMGPGSAQFGANLKDQFNYPPNHIHHQINQQTGQQTQSQQQSAPDCTFMHSNHPIFQSASTQTSLPTQQQPCLPNQFNQPSIICTPAVADQSTGTLVTQTQPQLQFLIDDHSDLNTTDINMDSASPCSESDLNTKQFGGRSHKDVWSPGSTTTPSTGSNSNSNSSCDMHSDSTIKLDPVSSLIQTDPKMAGIIPSVNVNNLSLNNIGEMNMVLGLNRLDLSNLQQQQANQLNQMNQQLNQQITSNLQAQQQSSIQIAQQPVHQTDTNLLVQQQIQQQIAQQSAQQQMQPNLPGYYLSNTVTPIANHIRPIVLDHNNNAVQLNALGSQLNQFNRTNEQTKEQRIDSPSTQSEASTNTQISKKIGIRVGSPPPEGQFKCWTLPRYVQQPFTQQQLNASSRYTPQYVMATNYNGQQHSSQANQTTDSLISARKQFHDPQQFASQILYTKQNRMNVELESPQSNSQPDLYQPDHHSITPTPSVNLQQQQQQQLLNYYPVHMHLEQAGLPDSYAKFCYETATHKFYTIPASVAQRGSILSLVAPPPSRYSDRTIKRRKQRRKQLKMSKQLNKHNSDESSAGEETDNELLDVNDGDDEIDLKLLSRDDEAEDESEEEERDVSSEDEDADNEERVQPVKSQSSTKAVSTSTQTTIRKDSTTIQKSNQHSDDLNATDKIGDEQQIAEDDSKENLDNEKLRTDKDNKRKKLSSQFVSSKKSKKSIKKSIKKRPTSKAEPKLDQMSANELLKSKLRQVKKKFELVNLLNDEEKKHTGKIADYLPGRSSVLVREKQKFYANLISYIDSVFNEVFSSTESLSDYENINDRRTAMSMGKLEDAHSQSSKAKEARKKRQQQLRKLQKHHQHSILSKNCAFNVLISDDTTTTNGYELDSSYIVRRREPIPAPVSRSVYSSVQKGDDIPFEGLRRSIPFIRPKDEIKFRKPLSIDSRDNIPTDQLNRYIDKELDWVNRETSILAQRRHHYNISPNHQILSFNRYQYAAANKSMSELSKSLLAKVLYDFRAVFGRELSVKKGDIVIVVRSVNNNWVEVEDIESGLRGLVPRNFLDYEQEGLAKAKYEFDAKTGVEVSFKKDEILRLIRKVDNNWFEGLNSKNESGIIPINYIEVMRLPLNLHYDNQFLNIICKGQSATPLSHPYTRSAHSTPQSSSYLSSNIRAKQIGSHPNLSIEPIIESDSANSSNNNNHQPPQHPNASFFYSRSSSAMCQNKALSQLQTSSIEQFAQKASLAASAPHLIDDAIDKPEILDKQQQTNGTGQSIGTVNQSQQTQPQSSISQSQQQSKTSSSTNQLPKKPIHPPLPLQSDFASTTSLATSSNLSQFPVVDPNYAFRNQLYAQQYFSPHPRNLANINNHLNNKRLPNHSLGINNPNNNSHMALKRLYRVLYPYKPRQSDELELIAGDIVSVSTHCDDGWYIGFSNLTGNTGHLPGNYVQKLA